MATKPFRYLGALPSGASFPDRTEVLFFPGKEVSLPDPAENRYVAGLLEKGLIEAIPEPAPQPDPKPAAKAAKNQGGE